MLKDFNKESAPYYLHEGDIEIIKEFNKKNDNEVYKLQTDLLPEPFIGDPKTAKLLMLALNPGYVLNPSADEKSREKFWHEMEGFKKLINDNRALAQTDYPYYYLNPDNEFRNSPGHKWTRRILKELIAKFGESHLAKNICCLQVHGYHSNRYKPIKEGLPSQEETINHIKTFIKKHEDLKVVPIVIMRAKKIWMKMVQELADVENKIIELNNYRNPTISSNNVKDGRFSEIVTILNQK